MSLCIDSGVGLTLSIWFVVALVLNSENIFYNVLGLDLGVAWCSYNEPTNHLTYLQTLVNKLLTW